MTVYVDNMRVRFGRMVMWHMVADSDEELHAMAARIGVARKWHQTAGGSHYDVCLAKRAAAVAAGAMEITLRQCAAMSYLRRVYKVHGVTPADAVARLQQEYAKKAEAARG